MRPLILLILVLFLSVAVPARVDAHVTEPSPKFIVIHVCSFSSYYLNSEMETGNLPNLQATFGQHGMIENVITYLPSKTPNVISSLRSGTPAEESRLISWTRADRESGEVVSSGAILREMVFSKPRIALPTWFYGTPVLHRLAGVALPNLPELLNEYHVLEFYWFPIDTYGHFHGEEHYLRKLRQFDKHFGRLMRRLDEDVNVIIYSDHGMVFEEGVDIYDEVKSVAGERITAISFPNIYIDDSGQAEATAKIVVEETRADFTFYRSDVNRVNGFHNRGSVTIRNEADQIFYSYEGEDPFGYYEQGYNGQGLTRLEWLELTYDMEYPASPVSIYSYFSNPRAGDILMLFDDTKFSRTNYSRRGNHGGFTYRDMRVPVLLKGPELEFMYGREALWLQDLFLEIDNVPFGHTPSRDRHYLNWWYNPGTDLNTMQVSFSPYYRSRVGTEFAFTQSLDVDNYYFWGKFDLYRSYLSRFWLGAGIETDGQDVSLVIFLRHELHYRRLTARSSLSTAGNHHFALAFRVAPPLSIQIVNFNSAGLRLHF